MQNSTIFSFARLVCATMIFFCANYGSMYAQGERKAFQEGDKVISVGIAGGGGSFGYSKATPSISFDYGLKGTRGIVSIGGFLGYSQNRNYYRRYGTSFSSYDSTFSISQSLGDQKSHVITTGLRLGLHYSTRKWDLYAGAMIGYQKTFVESVSETTDYYKLNSINEIPPFGNPPANAKPIKSEFTSSSNSNYGRFIFSPYVGARYYLNQKISLNLEAGQYTGNIGLGFKF